MNSRGKKIVVLGFLLVLVSVASFAQNVRIPQDLVGDWVYELTSDEDRIMGTQHFAILEIGENGSMRMSSQYFAFNSTGTTYLEFSGRTNGGMITRFSGKCHKVSDNEIVFTSDETMTSLSFERQGTSLIAGTMVFKKGRPARKQ